MVKILLKIYVTNMIYSFQNHIFLVVLSSTFLYSLIKSQSFFRYLQNQCLLSHRTAVEMIYLETMVQEYQILYEKLNYGFISIINVNISANHELIFISCIWIRYSIRTATLEGRNFSYQRIWQIWQLVEFLDWLVKLWDYHQNFYL